MANGEETKIPGLAQLLGQAPQALQGAVTPPPMTGPPAMYAPQQPSSTIPQYYRPQPPSANIAGIYQPQTLPSKTAPPNPMNMPLANPRSTNISMGIPSPLAVPPPTQQQQPERPAFDPNAIVRRGGTFEVKGPLSQRWQTMTPEYREGMQQYIEGLKGQNEIRKAQGEAALQQYEQANELQLQKQEINQRFAAQQYQRQQEYRQAREQFAEKRERILGEVNAIEPQDFWANKSTEQRILAGIGMAIGAAAQAYTRGENPAMQIIDRAIANDLELQRMNISKKRADLADTQGIMAQMKLEYDDDVTANDMARLASLQVVENRVQAMYLKAQNEQAKIGLGALDEELKTQIGEIQMRAAQNETVQAAQTTATRYQAPMTAGEAVMGYKGGTEFDSKKDNLYVKAYNGYAPTPEEAKEMRQGAVDRQMLRSFLGKLISFRKKYGSEDLPSEALDEAKTIHTMALMVKKNVNALGVLAGEDLPLLLEEVPKPGAKWVYPVTRYEANLKALNVKERAEASHKITPAYNIPDFKRSGWSWGSGTGGGGQAPAEAGFQSGVGETD